MSGPPTTAIFNQGPRRLQGAVRVKKILASVEERLAVRREVERPVDLRRSSFSSCVVLRLLGAAHCLHWAVLVIVVLCMIMTHPTPVKAAPPTHGDPDITMQHLAEQSKRRCGCQQSREVGHGTRLANVSISAE